MRAIALLLALLIALPWSAGAEPRAYVLERDRSEVAFTYVLEGRSGTGTMPIESADIVLDFENASRSSARIRLDAAEAQTGVFFVTEALKSDSVLDTDDHPTITFVSREFVPQEGGARVTGDVTVRGVTRPLTLDADIFRQRGTEAGDLSRLTVRLTGAIDRSDFGATGYPDRVADRVGLEITARLRAAE